MKTFQHIEIQYDNCVATIWLNRPEIHNAFNEHTIAELIEAFELLNDDEKLRIIILRGRGKSFCAGADLNWMRNVAHYTHKQNYRESYQLAKCFYTVYNSSKPTIGVAHGAVIGGANGLLAACDFAYAEIETTFAFSEVKIGIVPATISPYVVKRIGEFASKDLMLTGRRFKADEATRLHLLNNALPAEQLEEQLNTTIEHLKSSGPGAMAKCKNLIYDIQNRFTLCESVSYTAELIADIRASDEGQEGMEAFLEKRRPGWVKK